MPNGDDSVSKPKYEFVESPDDIVISGVACRLPESANMDEFRDHLIKNEDMVTDDSRRYPAGIHGIPKRCGKIKETTKFDGLFFKVSPKEANAMDPQQRMNHEVVYEALVDAGINPLEAKGDRTAVIAGASGSEAMIAWSMQPASQIIGYELTGCLACMLSNRISYFFDFHGPSYTIDTGCSAGLVALCLAFNHMRSGQADSAVVVCSNLLQMPTSTLECLRLGVLSPEGACKSFDEAGNGYCRSEGIAAIYLTKRKAARRIYGTVLNVRNRAEGFREEGFCFPCGAEQKQNNTEVYAEAGIDPADVVFVECHGTGTMKGDSQEVNSIVELFCPPRRKGPLLIGSTKSNMGHPEPAGAITSIAKLCVAMEERVIPANLHYYKPNPLIPGLVDGRLQVVATNTPFDGGLIGINSFALGGSDVHAIIKPNPGRVNHQDHPAADKKRLFTWAGRTEEAVERGLNKVLSRPRDVEMQALLEPNSRQVASGHPYRGYTLVNSSKEIKDIKLCNSTERPVWFVYSGMGAQWPGMGRDLMAIDRFRESMQKSHDFLKQYNIDLLHLVQEADEKAFDVPTNSFVGITAIQIALTDVLETLRIKPDGVVGHSAGEVGCGYGDGGLTAEEALLCAYWRGQCLERHKLAPGAMAAVGLTWEEAKTRCPQGIYPACHNAKETVTISGPADDVAKFVEELKNEGIFARTVNSSGVAFHSVYVQPVGDSYKAELEKVLTDPKPRTHRWLSTSVPEADWDKPEAKLCNAAYMTNNLLRPVLFQEALNLIPKDAIVIEISPHCLLLSLLKPSIGDKAFICGLAKKGQPDNLEFFLSSLGQIYEAGLNFDPLRLFPPVSFPVGRGTPMLSPVILWDHSDDYRVPVYEDFEGQKGGSGVKFEFDMEPGSPDEYLFGHIIDGRSLFPATGYVVLAWQALAQIKNVNFEELPVVMEDIKIHRATILPRSGKLVFDVTINQGTNTFEILESGGLVVSGKITIPEDEALELSSELSKPPTVEEGLIPLSSNDFYRTLSLRGYEYGPTFRGVVSMSNHGDDGTLAWTGNWISFVDTMLQAQVLTMPGNSLRLPTRFTAIRIDPRVHASRAFDLNEKEKGLRVINDHILDTCISGGVEVVGLHTTVAPRRATAPTTPHILEESHFIPYVEENVRAGDEEFKKYLLACQSVAASGLESILNNGIKDTLKNVDAFQKYLPELSKVKVPQSEIERYLADPNCALLQALHTVFAQPADINNNFLNNVYNVVHGKLAELSKDKLLSNLLLDRYFKSSLDEAKENSDVVMKVAEVGAVASRLFQFAVPFLSTHAMLTVDYSAIDTDPAAFEKVELEEFNLKTNCWGPHLPPPATLGPFDLVLASDLHEQNDLRTSVQRLKAITNEGGFVLIHEPTHNFGFQMSLAGLLHDFSTIVDPETRTEGPFLDVNGWKKLFDSEGFELVSLKSDGFLRSLLLFRKRAQTPPKAVKIIDVSSPTFEWVDQVKAAVLEERPKGENIWLISDSTNVNGIPAAVLCLLQEPEGTRVRCLVNEFGSSTIPKPGSEEFEALVAKDMAINIYRDGKVGRYGHIFIPQEPYLRETEHAIINVLTPGDLSSLRFIESPLRTIHPEDYPTKELCSVYYSALNFRDIMLATGKLPPDAIPGDWDSQDCLLGLEFSGRDSAGRRVMGLMDAKGLATSVLVDKQSIWPVPEAWSLEQAATVPVVYATVLYALVIRGHIRKGDKVLIHSGSGGIGQAAISVALSYGCEVFTTVGTADKKQFLLNKFPKLRADHISNSHDLSFEKDIRRVTRGYGVDVVLNSLAEDKLQASLRLLAAHGRFLEIGKYDLANDTSLGMSLFLRNVTFHGILLDALFEPGNRDMETVTHLLEEGVKNGSIQPLETTVFDKSNIEEAFRYMSSGKHKGKILLKMREEEKDAIAKPPAVRVKAIPKAFCDSRKSYVLLGGLGGFGLETAGWLIERGAKNIVITSRSGITNGYQSRKIRMWREAGVNVVLSNLNVIKYDDTVAILKEALKLGPVGGIFHLAMVLRDALMINQSPELFREVAEPKVTGTLNLDKASRELCKDSLDFFVVYSSYRAGRGGAGQTNYSYCNAVMDRICELRRKDGLPGLAVQWGTIGDVGVFFNAVGTNEALLTGIHTQRVQNAVQWLETFSCQSHPVMSSFVLPLRGNKAKGGAKQNIADAIAHIVGVKDMKTLKPQTTLGDLGLDSMMSVEVKQLLERDGNLVLSAKEIRQLSAEKILEIAESCA